MRISCLLLTAWVLLPSDGVAQTVVGIVLERDTGAPVMGAMVLLVDSAGNRVDRALTNSAGRFLVQAHAPGVHRVAVERIGYADWSTGPLRLDAAGRRLTVEVPFEAISLAGIDVRGGRRCKSVPEAGAATARVWGEARKALAAEAYTRETGLYRYTLRHYRRDLDRNGKAVLDERITMARHLRAAFSALPAEHLTSRGFVRPTDSLHMYYAPDAATLLSDAFLDTHCFGLREGHAGRIGLTFEPLPGRRVSEIEGVLWLDAASSELERLEFSYRNPFRDREYGKPGGEVAFTRVPNGTWIVREWAIRMPKLELVVRGRLRRIGYAEEAGVTWAVSDARGRSILHADSVSIAGVVTDSTGAGPPPEAVVVEVSGTGKQAVTEQDGSFLLVGLPAGRHLLAVQRPLLASLGLVSPEAVAAEGRLGEVVHVRLRLPTVADALVASCGGESRPGRTTAFLGRINTADGIPIDGVTVVARWALASGYTVPAVAAPVGGEGTREQSWRIDRDGGSVTATTTTDWRGLFLLCDVPRGLRLRLSVQRPADVAPALTETFLVAAEALATVETLTVAAGAGEG